jgi:hypothetical protein
MIKSALLVPFVLSLSFTPVQDDPVKLDGIINKAEWAGAKEHDLSSGGKLYILHNEDAVYFGIKGTAPGWAHIYLAWKDSVKVLHASAALGAQLYTAEKDNWIRQNKFTWENRERIYDQKLVQQQELYFQKNGWCANNNNTGDKLTLEYKIDIKRFGDSGLRFAALFTTDATSLSFFPATLNDDTLLKELVSGNGPDSLRFKPLTWASIKL